MDGDVSAPGGALVRQGVSPLLQLRWLVLLIGIPGLEILLVSLTFDTAIPSSLDGWSAWWVAQSPQVAKIALASAGAFALIATPHYPRLTADLAEHSARHRWGRWLMAHASAVTAFFFLTHQIIDAAVHSGSLPGTWVAAWGLSGLISVVLLALAVAPPAFWRSLLRSQWGAFLAALTAGVCAWGLGILAQQLWRPLAEATFWLAGHLLAAVGTDVVEGAGEGVIGTPSFLVRIAPQCSGYDGIALICVFLAIYLWLMRHELRFPHAYLLFPVAILAIWLSNVLRIAALVLIGGYVSPDIAAQGFHSQAGWLAFTFIALVLIGLVHRFRFFSAAVPYEVEVATRYNLAAALLVPFLVLLMSKMITAAWSAGLDLLYPLQVVATGAVLWLFRKRYAGLGWSWSWQAVGIGAVIFVLWVLLETPGSDLESGDRPMDSLPLGIAVIWIVFRMVGSAVTVPLAEELAFRGYLIRKLVSSAFERVPAGTFTWVSFLLSSLLFGLLHRSWVAGTVAGMGYALALYRRGRIGDAVVAHGTTNLLLAGYVLVFDQWGLWQ
jgi:exosortase E/protease (VPEID-CTERM system)